MEGEYVVMLGTCKIHTCTALRYKPAFIALASNVRGPRFDLGRCKRC